MPGLASPLARHRGPLWYSPWPWRRYHHPLGLGELPWGHAHLDHLLLLLHRLLLGAWCLVVWRRGWPDRGHPVGVGHLSGHHPGVHSDVDISLGRGRHRGRGRLSSGDCRAKVGSPTQFYSVSFSQSSIGVQKCVFNKRTIKVCVSCC